MIHNRTNATVTAAELTRARQKKRIRDALILANKEYRAGQLLPIDQRPPKRRIRNVTNERNRAIEREVYSNEVTAGILKNLGKHGESRNVQLLRACSIECNKEWQNLYGNGIPQKYGKRVVPRPVSVP